MNRRDLIKAAAAGVAAVALPEACCGLTVAPSGPISLSCPPVIFWRAGGVLYEVVVDRVESRGDGFTIFAESVRVVPEHLEDKYSQFQIECCNPRPEPWTMDIQDCSDPS